MKNIEQEAQKIWDYMKLNHKLEKSDAVVVFGSCDPSVADYAAELVLHGWAPLLVLSGNRGDSTQNWSLSEAETFRKIAIEKGVSEETILIENESTNTIENILFTQKLFQQKGISVQRIIVVQKPFMERRAFATIQKHWPDIEVILSSPSISFSEYKIPEFSREDLIGSIVGDLERLVVYAKQGDLVEQKIPEQVWQARDIIRGAGYKRRYLEI